MACEFGTTDLSLEEQIHIELVIVRRSSSVYLTEATMGTKFPASLGARVLCLEESSRASGLLYLVERGGAFLQKLVAIAAELANYSN